MSAGLMANRFQKRPRPWESLGTPDNDLQALNFRTPSPAHLPVPVSPDTPISMSNDMLCSLPRSLEECIAPRGCLYDSFRDMMNVTKNVQSQLGPGLLNDYEWKLESLLGN